MTVGEAIHHLQSDSFKEDNEPVFILRGRDILAYQSVREWAMRAIEEGVNSEKVREALRVAAEISEWPNKRLPD